MRNVKELLDVFFTFERHQHPVLKEGIAQSFRDTFGIKAPFRNKRLQSDFYGVYAICPHIHSDRKGYTIVAHAPDYKINRKSNKKLPYPLDKYDDCENMYYGLYLNIMAFLSGGRIKNLHLYHMLDDNKKIVFQYRPEIAEQFLSAVLDIDIPVEEEEVKYRNKPQPQLFAA
jgi:hypothetical protein